MGWKTLNRLSCAAVGGICKRFSFQAIISLLPSLKSVVRAFGMVGYGCIFSSMAVFKFELLDFGIE